MPATRTATIVLTARDLASGKIKGLGGTLKAVGAIGAAVGAYQIGRLFVRGVSAAVEAASSFEEQMSRVRAISRASASDMAELSDQSRKLGATTVFTATQAAEAQAEFAKAGFQVREILDALPGTLDLASAGELGLAEAASITSNILRAYGKDAAQAADVSDLLAKAANTANQTVGDLGDSFRFAAPAAKVLGVTADETAAAVSILADRGLKGSLAGTALARSFSVFLGQLEPGEEGLGKLSSQLFDAQGNFVGLAGAVRALRENNVTAAQAFKIFGERAGKAMAILLDLGPEALEKSTARLLDRAGFAAEVAGTKLDNLRGDVTILQSAFDGLKRGLGEDVTPVLRVFAQAATQAVTGVSEFEETTDTLGTTVIDAGIAIAETASIIEGFARRIPGGPIIELLDKLIEFQSTQRQRTSFVLGTALKNVGESLKDLDVPAQLAPFGLDVVAQELADVGESIQKGAIGLDDGVSIAGEALAKLRRLKEERQSGAGGPAGDAAADAGLPDPAGVDRAAESIAGSIAEVEGALARAQELFKDGLARDRGLIDPSILQGLTREADAIFDLYFELADRRLDLERDAQDRLLDVQIAAADRGSAELQALLLQRLDREYAARIEAAEKVGAATSAIEQAWALERASVIRETTQRAIGDFELDVVAVLDAITARTLTWTDTVIDGIGILSRGISTALGDVLLRGDDFADGLRNTLENLGQSVLDFLIEQGAQWVVATLLGAKASAAQHVARMGQLASQTYAAAFAAIAATPIFGPALAPGAAAAAVLAMLRGSSAAYATGVGAGGAQGIAGFRTGGILDGPGPSGVDNFLFRGTRGETVLDTVPSEGRAILQGRAAIVPAGAVGGGRGNLQLNVHIGAGADGRSIARMLRRDPEALLGPLRRARRLGRV